MWGRRYAVAAVLLALVAVAPACSSKGAATDIVEAGQVDIKLPPGWKVVDGTAVRPASGSAAGGSTATPAGGASGAGTGDAIPLAKEDTTTAFFKATGSFQNCLKERGTKFIGAPDQSKPDSPANNPEYVKSLSTCAASSKIVQALQDMQKSQDNLTPEQIKTQNEQYLKWRTCKIGRHEQRKVNALAEGTVTAVHIDDGATVEAGAPIVAVDGRDAVAEQGDLPFFRGLDIGSQGEDVRQLKTILRAAGLNPGSPD